MENVTLNQKEQVRLQILNSLLAEHMTVDQAAMLMGVSTRHTRRILAAYREEGSEQRQLLLPACCLTRRCYRTFRGFQLTPTGPMSTGRSSFDSLFSAEAYTSCFAITPRHCLTRRCSVRS